MKLTQERLKEILHYNPDTGIFTWKVSLSSRPFKEGIEAGYTHKGGYRIICLFKKDYGAHRLAFLYMEGYLPENQVDHINRIKDDNRWSNLRHVSRSCNIKNSKINIKNKHKVTGIGYYDYLSNKNKWIAYIVYSENKTKRLGYFNTKEEAVRARWEAEKKYNYPSCNSTSSAYLWLKERGLIEEVQCNVKRSKDTRLSESRQNVFNFQPWS